MSERNQGRPWQAHEDALLVQAVSNYCGDIDWKEIAKHVPERTNKACRKRWLHSLSPTVKKTPWTKEEDSTLLSVYEHHGPKWSLIARHIPGRTDDACSKRYREALDPTLKKDDWTAEEDARLLELYVSLGGKWMQVGQQMGRSSLGCRNRWRLLERRRLSGKTIRPPHAAEGRLEDSLPANFVPTISDPSVRGFDGSLPEPTPNFEDSPSDWTPPGFFWDPHFAAVFSYPAGSSQAGASSETGGPSTSSSSVHASPLPPTHPSYAFHEPFLEPLQQSATFVPSGPYLRAPDEDVADDVNFIQPPPPPPPSSPVPQLRDRNSETSSPRDNQGDVDESIQGHDHDPQTQSTTLVLPPSQDPVPTVPTTTAAEDLPSHPHPVEAPASILSRRSTPPIPSYSSLSPSHQASGELPRNHEHASGSTIASTSRPDAQAQPFLSSSLPADNDVMAYACGYTSCWSSDDEGAGSGVRFATSKELADHMRETHSDDLDADSKPYRCALRGCKKSWKSLNGLQYHLQVSKVHFRQALAATPLPSDSGDKPRKKTYPCTFPQCLHVYKQASGLRYHLKHGHPIDAPAQLPIVPPSLARKVGEKLHRAGSSATASSPT